MNKTHLTTLSAEAENMIFRLSNIATASSIKEQKRAIKEDSPYSKMINDSISNYKEFFLYYSLQLKEATVTRRALIKDLDLDLWVSCENKTNRELLKEGFSPYAYDSEKGKIELHHIGQAFDSPFAELTVEEHDNYGNDLSLHSIRKGSWRNDESKYLAYQNEKKLYWKLRADNEISYIKTKEFVKLEPRKFDNNEATSAAVNLAIERLFEELSADDLNYISNLANSYSMVKQIGAKSINEFINKKYDGKEATCSFCGESNYVSHGTYKTASEVIKRYKCKKCHKVFTQVNNCIMSGSNLSFMEWVRFIDCLYSGYSVTKTAAVCGLSENAVQENKYKIFYALKQLDDEVKLSGNIVIDETYFDVSYKGNHRKNGPNIKRRPRKRGGEKHTPGLSKENVCVVCAMDDEGQSVARVCGLGGPNANKLVLTLEGVFDAENVACVYADMEKALTKFGEIMNLPMYQQKQLKKGKKTANIQELTSKVFVHNRYLQRMNSYHSRLHDFVEGFGGTSSRFLAGYLYLFAWKERNKGRDKYEAYKELLDVMTKRNNQLHPEMIASGLFLPDPFRIEYLTTGFTPTKEKRAKHFVKMALADKVYALYASGMSHVQIAKRIKMTPQGVGRIIRKYDALGLGYKTEKEKEKERKLLEPSLKRQKKAETAKQCVELYEQHCILEKRANDFIREKAKEFRLSEQTIGNRISKGRRIVALREEFLIGGEHEVLNLRETYQAIYSRVQELQKNSNYKKGECYQIVADEYGYVVSNIQRIVAIMKKDPETYFNRNKIRLSKKETTERDKAIFAEYVRWKGEYKNFVTWAAEKYNISESIVRTSISFCLTADERRYSFL